MSKSTWIILIVIVVAIAFHFFGELALAGLLGLFKVFGGKSSDDLQDHAEDLNRDAEMYRESADVHVNAAKDNQDQVKEIDAAQHKIVNEKVNHNKLIDEEIEDGKNDWT